MRRGIPRTLGEMVFGWSASRRYLSSLSNKLKSLVGHKDNYALERFYSLAFTRNDHAGYTSRVVCTDHPLHRDSTASTSRIRSACVSWRWLPLDSWIWAYAADGYFWVPGTWVLAPEPGFLWTPGYWAGAMACSFLTKGIGVQKLDLRQFNYGFGYVGVGFLGGEWRGGSFFYNRSVANVTNITNVYEKTVVVNNVTVNNVSYNGGEGGVTARPTAAEEAAENATCPANLRANPTRAGRQLQSSAVPVG